MTNAILRVVRNGVFVAIVIAPLAWSAEPPKLMDCPRDPAEDKSDEHPALHQQRPPKMQLKCPVDRIANEDERRLMQKYVDSYIDRDAIVRSIELGPGETVDCVDRRRQPSLKHPLLKGHVVQLRPKTGDPKEGQEALPRAAGIRLGDPDGKRPVREVTQDYGAPGKICPEGSIPIRRLTMETLKSFRTLKDFFRKNPPHYVQGPTNLHQYAHAYRSVANWGAQSILNVWSPYVSRTDEFSLSQIWVTGGSGDGLQTVEVGWQKYYDLYGDWRPRLFIYFTADNYDDTGCYNLSCFAFIQVANNVYIGGGFTNVSSHPHPSAAWEFKIRWQKDGTTGNWWLKYGDTWVGYYIRGFFSSKGLRDQAAVVDFGGEIIDEQASGNHTSTDMGSGHMPADGFGYAAYQRQIRYITTSNVWSTRPSLTETRSDSDCYDIEMKSSTGSWERHFYFGGYGYSSHCQ